MVPTGDVAARRAALGETVMALDRWYDAMTTARAVTVYDRVRREKDAAP